MSDLFEGAVSSRRNPHVRQIAALGHDAGARREAGVYLAEGLKLVREALDSGAEVREVFVSPRLRSTREGTRLLSSLRARQADLTPVTDAVLELLADATTPQGVVAVLRMPSSRRLRRPAAGHPLLVCWKVQDPGNLGALVRTAEATGAAGVVAAGGGVDPYHPRVVRAAAGSLFRRPPFYMAPSAPVGRVLREAGYRLVAASPKEGTVLSRFDWNGRWALAIGSEGGGLPPGLTRGADAHVHVPMEGNVESLSVPAAAAVMLYEAMRQRAFVKSRGRPHGRKKNPRAPGKRPLAARRRPGAR